MKVPYMIEEYVHTEPGVASCCSEVSSCCSEVSSCCSEVSSCCSEIDG